MLSADSTPAGPYYLYLVFTFLIIRVFLKKSWTLTLGLGHDKSFNWSISWAVGSKWMLSADSTPVGPYYLYLVCTYLVMGVFLKKSWTLTLGLGHDKSFNWSIFWAVGSKWMLSADSTPAGPYYMYLVFTYLVIGDFLKQSWTWTLGLGHDKSFHWSISWVVGSKWMLSAECTPVRPYYLY
jgi:hypothetical protein